VKTILVTGASAVGKSSLAHWLRERGHQAVSLDGGPGLCDWVDEHDRSVPWPTDPDLAWLAQHRWIWRPDVLDGVIADAIGRARPHTLFLCGRADNARDLTDRFDAVIGLLVDPQTVTSRLDRSGRGNPYGRMGDSCQLILDTLDGYQQELGAWADSLIDGRKPLGEVGEDVLAAASLVLLRAP
jgi:hypothetical protein